MIHVYVGYLNLSNKSALERTLRMLRASPFSDNIECDTSTILLAYHLANEKFDISMLENFLSVRSSYTDQTVNLSLENSYLSAIGAILDPVKKTRHNFNFGSYSYTQFSRNIPADQYSVVLGYNHMTIVYRTQSSKFHPAQWTVFTFSSNGNLGTQSAVGSQLNPCR